MTPLQGLCAAISAVILFLHGLQGFSRELQALEVRRCSHGWGA
jgi:phosphate:Na+ symporter